jgi:Ca2+-binding RTX toxin-like protein
MLAIAAALAAMIGFGAANGSAADIFTCNGLTPTIIGAGEIHGTAGNDVIIGSAGDDVIFGSSGHDTICGEGGNDVIHGDSGNDQMWGGVKGAEPIDGVDGVDELYGDSGNDLVVDPTGGFNYLTGNSGRDTILGAGEMEGESGADELRVLGAPSFNSTLNAGSGSDTCTPRTDLDVLISCEDVNLPV